MLTAPTHRFTGTLRDAPSGRAAAHYTVSLMRQLVNRCKTDPGIIQAAVSALYLAPQKDRLAEIEAIFDYVQNDIRYVRDVVGVETLCDPRMTIRRRVGDCDDQATLLATLFESVGYPTRFVMSGYRTPKDFEHVYLQVLVDRQWISADPTEPYPLGWAPPNPRALWVEKR